MERYCGSAALLDTKLPGSSITQEVCRVSLLFFTVRVYSVRIYSVRKYFCARYYSVLDNFLCAGFTGITHNFITEKKFVFFLPHILNLPNLLI